MQQRKRKFGDRYDGWRIRTGKPDLFFTLIPHIMRTRVDSQCYFDERIDLEPIEKLLQKLRKDGQKNIKTYHVFMAAIIRTISQRPRINRFVAGSKIYARNHINLSIAIKRSMSDSGEETTIKPRFEPSDTLLDVAEKVNASYIESAKTDGTNGTDNFVKAVLHLPSWVNHFIVFFMRNLDKIGWMPKSLNEVSPFHASAFLTDVGSIGISSIYHHLYEFGTTSVFISMGRKERRLVIAPDGMVKEKRFINVRVVVDERICDGFYYGSTFKLFQRIMAHPEILLEPPETIVYDT